MVNKTEYPELYSLVLPKENLDVSDDGREEDESKSYIFDSHFTFHDTFHTKKILMAENIKGTQYFISIAEDGKMIVRDLNNDRIMFNTCIGNDITSASFDKNRGRIYIGSKFGSLRVLEINKQLSLKEIDCIRIDKTNSVTKIVIDSSYCFVQAGHKIVVIDVGFEEKLSYFGFLKTTKQALDFDIGYNEELDIFCLFEKGILIKYSIKRSSLVSNKRLYKFKEDGYSVYGNKIDIDLYKLAFHQPSNFLYCVGEDLIIKKYKNPKDQIEKLEKKMIYPYNPMEEIDILDSDVNFFRIIEDDIISGLDDGVVVQYNITTKKQQKELFGSFESGGVSFIGKNPDLIVATQDGGVAVLNYKSTNKLLEDPNLKIDKKMTFILDKDIEYYQDVIDNEFLLKIFDEKKDIEKDMLKELAVLKEEYNNLLTENNEIDDSKKIPYDDFCIDVDKRNKLEEEGKEKVELIYREADKYVCHNELVHSRIREMTFDQMEIHFKTITGFEEKLIVYNFPLQKINKKETTILNKIKMLRRFEQKESEWRKEKEMDLGIQISSIVSKHADFVVNGVPVKPQLILTDYEKREAEIKEYKEEQRKRKEALNNLAKSMNVKKKKFEIKNRERKRKKCTQMGGGNNNKLGLNMSKIKKPSLVIPNGLMDEAEDWMMIYPSIMLMTKFRKINQIYFIKNIIRVIKKEFNKVFNDFLKLRNQKKDQLMENNEKILEIQKELEINEKLLKPVPNIIERVKDILTVNESEIFFKKYLTKAEKKRQEIEMQKEKERLAALNANDTNLRALKMMMNNTLEDKNDKVNNGEIAKEDWMDKTREEMTEEERNKYDEYLKNQEQLQEEAERMRKILTQELKKLKIENREIINEFDSSLRITFMVGLEYNYRVLEQEYFVSKLKQSLHNDEQIKIALGKLDEEIKEKLDGIQNILRIKERLLLEINENNRTIANSETDIQKMETKLMKQVMQFITGIKDDIKKNDYNDDEFNNSLKEKKRLGKIPYENPFNIYLYNFIHDKYQFDEEIYFDRVKEMLNKKLEQADLKNELNRFMKLLKIKKSYNNQVSLSKDFVKFVEFIEEANNKKNEELKELKNNSSDLKKFLDDNKNLSYLMLRLNSETIEVNVDKIIPVAENVVLIDKNKINNLNREIINFGNTKVNLLKKSLEEKQKVESDLSEVRILEKEIKDALIEIMILTRLKVSKKLQLALSKKDDKIVETEEINVKKQIDKLLTTTENSINNLRKKENAMIKEINNLNQENEKLLIQGGKLQESVNQRQEIFNMIFQQKPENLENEDANKTKNLTQNFKKDDAGYNKAMDIAKNRRLFDLAKKLAHEIEALMVELKRLKEKTYPNLN